MEGCFDKRTRSKQGRRSGGDRFVGARIQTSGGAVEMSQGPLARGQAWPRELAPVTRRWLTFGFLPAGPKGALAQTGDHRATDSAECVVSLITS
ncbi:unnamed protein product, partial [Iphiclides podalirius]